MAAAMMTATALVEPNLACEMGAGELDARVLIGTSQMVPLVAQFSAAGTKGECTLVAGRI
jgi:hypothetical protein